VENQKKLQLQKLFQITPSFFTNFSGIFLPPYLFPAVNSVYDDLISIGNFLEAAPPVRDCFFRPGSPVRGRWTPSAMRLQRPGCSDRAGPSAADGLHAVVTSSTPVSHRPAVVCSGRRHSLSPFPAGRSSTSKPSSIVGYYRRRSTFTSIVASGLRPAPPSHPRAPP
jgi:hypothetical protein